MAKWVWPAATGVVTSATGVAINLATDAGTNPWAWVAVVLLTALGVVVALRSQAPPRPGPAAAPPAPERGTSNLRNDFSGSSGVVVQAGTVHGGVNVNSPTTVDQIAVARDGGAVHQAGRDVRRD